MSKEQKVVVIGLDGATFDVIDPMIEAGELPNIAELCANGVRGPLRSTFPPITHAAWSTFSTGKNPAKHGVMDFVEPPYWNDDNAGYKFTNFSSIKCAPFWQILNDSDLKIGIINLPMTFPPTPLNGYLVGGIDTPSEQSNFTYPSDLIERLKGAGINYRPDYVEVLRYDGGQAKRRHKQEVIDDYFQIEEERRKSILYLMDNEPWDLLVAVVGVTDRIAHHFWQFHDPADPEAGGRFREVVRDSYRKADEIIGDIRARLDDDVHVMVMSDHGFGSYDRLFFINSWLKREGFLKLRKTRLGTLGDHYRMLKLRKTIREVLRYFRLGPVAGLLPRKVAELSLGLSIPFPVVSPSRVDWQQTRAYGGAFGIYVNIKGRTSRGVVDAGDEYDRVRTELQKRLLEAQDPKTGKRLIARVYRKEEVFSGPFLKDAPDLYIEPEDPAVFPTTTYLFRNPLRNKRFGNHKMDGMLIMCGPAVSKGGTVEGARIEDCLSNIFYLLGHPVPSDFDGRLLDEAYVPEHLAQFPLKTGPAADQAPESGQSQAMYTAEDEDLIRTRLRSLGYID